MFIRRPNRGIRCWSRGSIFSGYVRPRESHAVSGHSYICVLRMKGRFEVQFDRIPVFRKDGQGVALPERPFA